MTILLKRKLRSPTANPEILYDRDTDFFVIPSIKTTHDSWHNKDAIEAYVEIRKLLSVLDDARNSPELAVKIDELFKMQTLLKE